MKDRVNVTKTHLPPLEDFQRLIAEIWESGQLTNLGVKQTELQDRLREYLGVKHLQLVNNGTIALQLAIKALNLKGEVITTPFSYVATVSSIVWEGCTPVFVDVSPIDLCIDPSRIEAAITEHTTAILATHVYGHPCAVHEIQRIANKHNLRVIYDAAHAFGVKIDGESVLNHGDISTLSFHATKVFHTGEGGAVVTNNDELAHRMKYLGNFGHKNQEEFFGLGVNAKMSEFHAAMGLCVLPHMDLIVENRKKTIDLYDNLLQEYKGVYRIRTAPNVEHNYAYYPILLDSEKTLLKVRDALNGENIYPRRYFYPSLNLLPYMVPTVKMPVAEDASRRALCLPLSSDFNPETISTIASIIVQNL
jgi:dTDP-4-amino-4,6-dideoxygalactose transaminase